jgi:hypothetical protein
VSNWPKRVVGVMRLVIAVLRLLVMLWVLLAGLLASGVF